MSLDTNKEPGDYQFGWKQCSRCFSLFYAGSERRAGCCIGGAEHFATHSGFEIAFAGQSLKGQENWRWCFKCSALFFNGHWKKGFCPADGAWHSPTGSENNYELLHTTDPKLANSYGWRWCQKCEQLYFCPFEQCLIRCPAGDRHSKEGSGFYFVKWFY